MPGTGAQNETPEHRPETLLAPNARVETAVPSSHVEGQAGAPLPPSRRLRHSSASGLTWVPQRAEVGVKPTNPGPKDTREQEEMERGLVLRRMP